MSRHPSVGDAWKQGEAVKERAEDVFVDREKFLELLVSRRRLRRANDSDAQILGLIDPDTGQRFLIEKTKLLCARGGISSQA